MADATQTPAHTISLCITHPEIEPDFLSQKLGLTPCRADRKGETTKRLTFLEGTPAARIVNARSFWNHHFDPVAEESLDQALRRLLSKLKEHLDLLAWLVNTNGKVSVTTYLEPSSPSGQLFDYDLITEFRRLRIGFAIEYFPRDDYYPGGRRKARPNPET